MMKFIDEIEADKYKFAKPLYKFENLLYDTDTILTQKELNMLENWGFTKIDVVEIGSDEFVEIPGVTDIVDEQIIENLKKANVSEINSVEALEKIDFEIDTSKCVTPEDLYIADAVVIPENLTTADIINSNNQSKKTLEEIFTDVENGTELNFSAVKMMVTTKIEEFKSFSKELLNSIFIGNEIDYVYRHSLNVMIIALAIGRKLGYKENFLAELGIAAMLHDIGIAKIDKSHYINQKTYDFNEFFEILKHPILGIDYMTRELKSKFGGMVSLAVYQHHERLDGSGYPKGKSGISITEYARIIAVCDVFEAMTSDRSHRKGVSAIEAFKYIANNSTILFDKKIIDIFYEILIENEILPRDTIDINSLETSSVIIADTSPYNLWYICHIMRMNNIPVFAAKDSYEIFLAAEKYLPKVIMVDASVTSFRGIDVLKELKSRPTTKEIPLIYSSTSGDKFDVMNAVKIGISDYLIKPYSFDFVVNRLGKYLKT